MAQIIDASIGVAWCVQNQAGSFSDAVLTATIDHGGRVPPQFWFEVLHSVSRLQRRGAVGREIVSRFLETIPELPLIIEPAYSAEATCDLYRLADRYALSIYDASYLELALRAGLPIATRDEKLARAAKQAGVSLFTA